jgi:adenylate cyclase
MERRLAAIVAADVVGYSRLMGADEAGTLARLKALRAEVVDPAVAGHRGRTVKLMGDGALIEFASVVDAVNCAAAIQRAVTQRGADEPDDQRILLRMGINLGDVIIDGDDIYGDGVNVAARLEALAEPGGIALSASAHDHVAGKVDVAFEDAGEHTLKNIVKPVHVYRWSDAAAPAETGMPSTNLAAPLTGIPSIAVLPFNNLSTDPEQEFFADGLVEDIITTLSKLAGLRVIARNSSFVYKGLAVDVREVARQLGVRYILEGSVRKSANRIRITAQLIDATSGSHVWAERYDRAVDDIFAVQDEITLVLATEMQVNLTEGEQARLHYTTTSNVEAWTQWVKGLSYFRQAVTKENSTVALACWQKALALDPASAALNGMISFLHYVDARFGWWDDRKTAIGKARVHADRALELDPDNPDATTASSFALLLEGRYEDAAVHARRLARLAPGSADAATFACFVLSFAGYPEEAVAHGERALSLSPNSPGFYLGHLGNAYRLAERFDEAITAFKAYNARHAGFGLSDLVIAYRQTGQLEAAAHTAAQLLSVRPDFTIEVWANTQFRADKARLEADIAELRAAGLPAT